MFWFSSYWGVLFYSKMIFMILFFLQLREYAVTLKGLVDKNCSDEEMKAAKVKMMTEVCRFVCESHDLQVSSVYYFITNICTLINLLNRVWKIINNNWMRLSKIWFVYLPEASRSIIQLRQVVDL